MPSALRGSMLYRFIKVLGSYMYVGYTYFHVRYGDVRVLSRQRTQSRASQLS